MATSSGHQMFTSLSIGGVRARVCVCVFYCWTCGVRARCAVGDQCVCMEHINMGIPYRCVSHTNSIWFIFKMKCTCVFSMSARSNSRWWTQIPRFVQMPTAAVANNRLESLSENPRWSRLMRAHSEHSAARRRSILGVYHVCVCAVLCVAFTLKPFL